MDQNTIEILVNCRGDDRSLAAGEVLVVDGNLSEDGITKAAADILVSIGKAKRPPPGPAAGALPADLDETFRALFEVFEGLDQDDKTVWTKTGKPEVNAISERTGSKVSAKGRDAAWAAYREWVRPPPTNPAPAPPPAGGKLV